MILDYLKRYGNISFCETPLTDVDLLILSQMACLDFDCSNKLKGVPLKSVLAVIGNDDIDASEMRFCFQQKDDSKLKRLVIEAGRYRDILFHSFERDYSTADEKQFAALSLLLPDSTLLIVYRGTDTTLAGWKEDCNLAFEAPVPSQTSALKFLNKTARTHKGPILLAGHSKGGNLAVYAATFCRPGIADRIADVLSFDGPGMPEYLIKTEGYQAIRDKIRVVMPRASIVGLFFEQPEPICFIESTAPSILQHYPYTWKTQAMGFHMAKSQSPDGRFLGQTMQGFLEKLDSQQRRQFVDLTYKIIRSSEAETIQDLLRDWTHNTTGIIRAAYREDPETRKIFGHAMRAFWKSAAEVLMPAKQR